MSNRTPTSVIYCRVSSKDQLEGTSLELQERACREYAEKHGMDVQAVFIERGESAKTAHRTEFNKALALCAGKQSKIDFFVVYKLDRFARNQDDHVTVRAILSKHGTVLRSVTEPIDQSPIGRAMEGILSVFAEFDNNVRTERTRAGMIERVKQGFWVWREPWGYVRTSQGANISPDPRLAQPLRWAFERYAQGGSTYRDIADYLNRLGVRAPSTRDVYPALVQKLLSNPIYSGIIEAFGGRFPGKFEPIVDQLLFERCQAVSPAGGRRPYARPRDNAQFPLRGFVICSACGETLTASTSRNRSGKRYSYYHHKKWGCPRATSIPKATIEAQFEAELRRLAPSSDCEKVFREVAIEANALNVKRSKDHLTRLEQAHANLVHERQRVFDFHRQGIYSDAEFAEQRDRLDTEIQKTRQLIAELPQFDSSVQGPLDTCFALWNDLVDAWHSVADDPVARTRLLTNIFTKPLRHDGSSFRTTFPSRVFRVFESFSRLGSTLVALRGIEPRLPH